MRVNLASNYTFKDGSIAGWAGENGATRAYTTDYAFYGVGGLLVTKAASNASGVVMNAPIAVQAGKPYAISMYARLPLTIPQAHQASLSLTVTWSNSIGVVVGTNTSGSMEITSDDEWYRISGVWTAPVGATVISSIRIYQPIADTAGQQFVLDALLVEQAAYVGGFFYTYTEDQKYTLANKALSRVPQLINGLRLGADISLNNLTFNTIDEFGTIWIIENIGGWDGQTNPEMPDIGRGTGDGSYDVEGRLTARSLTLSGFFIPANPDEALTAAKDRLVEAIDLVRKGGWLRAHSDPTRAAWVRLSSAPGITTVNDRGRTTFSISLRAPDPIKYHWDDSDDEGCTRFTLSAADMTGIINNIGNAEVTAEFTITGPTGPGTRIYNARTDETITLAEPLRGKAVVGNVIKMSAYENVATLTTDSYSGLRAGDRVTLLGLPVPFNAPGTIYTILSSSDVFPFSFSFDVPTDDIDEVLVSGQVSLNDNDVLVIDTYEKSVAYNGEISGHRYRLVTLTDWLTFGSGVNPIEFFDDALQINAVNKQINGTTATLNLEDLHYLRPGDQILVALPETADLSKKSLSANVVTMTTQEPHGFAVGDTVNVSSQETTQVELKVRTGGTVTLTTVSEHGISVGDFITVALPVTAVPSQKQLTTNVATITTQNAHGFSIGDTVTVALPVSATVSVKQLLSNVATLTTTTSHGYAVGDSITVTMPTASAIVGKDRIGSQAYIETVTAHGFSVGDTVIMALPTSATPTGNFVTNATTNLVTVTTTAAHGFSVGDKITMSHTGTFTKTVTNRLATASLVTLTIGASHGYVVGERITVTGVGARYNGTYFISAVASTTISYASTGAAEASTASSGSVVNNTATSDFNGSKVIESVPTTTTFTFRAWSQTVAVTRPVDTSLVTNNTNTSFNGTKTLLSASGTTFTYSL